MLPFVVDLALRITVAAGLIGLVLAMLRVRSAAARHTAWTALLLAMLAMPLLTAIVPRIPVPVPSQLRASPGAAAAEIEKGRVGALLQLDPLPPSGAPVADARPLAWPPYSQSPDTVDATSPIDWFLLAAAIYLLGVVLMATRLLVGWRMARRLLRGASRLELAAAAPVLESAAIAAPLTTGVLRPSIVLPTAWRRWPADTLQSVLAHENAHVHRRDLMIQLLARINQALYWFHPLAWWLERRLAATAEQACDEAVVCESGRPDRYAEILLAMAEATTRRGSRIVWTAIGMDGSGLLGTRIDRLLRGDAEKGLSPWRRVATAACCTIAMLLAVACQPEAARPLRPDEALAERLRQEPLRTKRFESARDMPLATVDALEARIAKDPNDWDAREQLVTYYSAGREVPWERKVPGLRRHALWLIEHHPEHDLAPPALSPEYDPEGFAQAVRLWEAHLQGPAASPFLVFRAARFFAAHDKRRAEQLILQGLAMDPQSQAVRARTPDNVVGYNWPAQLAMLYSTAILGIEHSGYPGYNERRARSPYAMEVRQRLAASTDATLLMRVGRYLSRRSADTPEEIRALGNTYLERALEIDPDLSLARAALVATRVSDRHQRIYDARTNKTPVADADRLAYLAERAQYGEMAADSASYYRNDQAAAAAQRAEAAKHAEEALQLAATRTDDPTYSSSVATVHFVLATRAIRDGNRDKALEHLDAAASVPPSDDIAYYQGAEWLRPVNYLLKAGERERVIQFLEAFARINAVQRERLLEDANDIREGRMPSAYQRMLARESAPGVDSNADPLQRR